MASELISVQEASDQLRIDSSTTEGGLPQKIASATRAIEDILGFAVIDAIRDVSALDDGGIPSSSTAIIEIGEAKVISASVIHFDGSADQSEDAARVSSFGVNERTLIYPPSGGWSEGLIGSYPRDVRYRLSVGAQVIEPIWKEAGLMLLTSLYDDRQGDGYGIALRAAGRLLASERRRV